MKLENFIHHVKIDLMPGVPLHVYALKGKNYSVIIDSGIKQMRDQIIQLCKETKNIKKLLITHAHADHIGCNVSVKKETNAEVYAAGAIPWIEDMEIHYKEFCIPSEFLPDSPEQREEILGLMEGAVKVDKVISEGMKFNLDENIELTAFAFPGHKLEEVAFLESSTKTLFMGDVLLALAAPFFHGFQTARGFRKSLDRIEEMINAGKIERILAAHHPRLGKDESLKSINDTRNFLNDVEQTTISCAQGVPFHELWKNVCSKLNKQLEFRGFAMLEVQVKELIEDGKLKKVDGKIFRT